MKKILFALSIVTIAIAFSSCKYVDETWTGHRHTPICRGELPKGRSFNGENYSHSSYVLYGLDGGGSYLYRPSRGCAEIVLLPPFSVYKGSIPSYVNVTRQEVAFLDQSLAWYVTSSNNGSFWIGQGGSFFDKYGKPMSFTPPVDQGGSSPQEQPYSLPAGRYYTGENYSHSGYTLKGVNGDMFLYDNSKTTPQLYSLPAFANYSGSIPNYVKVTRHEAIKRSNANSLAWRVSSSQGNFLIIQGGAFLNEDGTSKTFKP